MSKYKSQGFSNTFKNARRGIRLALKSELNIRIHLVFTVIAIALALYLHMSVVKLCLVIIAIALVITAEMINTGLEFGLDAVFHNKYSKLVGMAKDISAAAVLFTTFVSIILGLLLFGSEIYTKFF